jgi:hypothetical protein
MLRLRHTIFAKAPEGAIAVTEPYREGVEDWMLTRTINQLQAAGTTVVLVEERASRERGSFVGIAVYRIPPYQHTEPATPPCTPPQNQKRKSAK